MLSKHVKVAECEELIDLLDRLKKWKCRCMEGAFEDGGIFR